MWFKQFFKSVTNCISYQLYMNWCLDASRRKWKETLTTNMNKGITVTRSCIKKDMGLYLRKKKEKRITSFYLNYKKIGLTCSYIRLAWGRCSNIQYIRTNIGYFLQKQYVIIATFWNLFLVIQFLTYGMVVNWLLKVANKLRHKKYQLLITTSVLKSTISMAVRDYRYHEHAYIP